MNCKKLIVGSIALIGLTWGGAAYADCTGYACTAVTIEELYVSNQIYIRTSADETQLSCAGHGSSGTFLLLDIQNHPTAKEIYAMLMNLYMTQVEVTKIVFDPNETNCNILYVTDRQ